MASTATHDHTVNGTLSGTPSRKSNSPLSHPKPMSRPQAGWQLGAGSQAQPIGILRALAVSNEHCKRELKSGSQ